MNDIDNMTNLEAAFYLERILLGEVLWLDLRAEEIEALDIAIRLLEETL